MSLPHGPHAIGQKNQVTLPIALLRTLNLEAGDDVWFEVAEEPAGCLLVMPAEAVAKVWEAGRAQTGRASRGSDG